MVKQIIRLVIILLSFFLLFACDMGKKAEFELQVNVTLDGKFASDAKVLLDGDELGMTDNSGYFSKKMKKQPGSEVQVSVHKEARGYNIEPWKDSFVLKLPKDGVVDIYKFKAALKSVKYFTIFVSEDGSPIESASIRIDGKSGAKTDGNGEYVYNYQSLPEKGVDLKISKNGFTSWHRKVKAMPGQILEVALLKKEEVKQPVVVVKPVKKAPVQVAPVAKATPAKAPAKTIPKAKPKPTKSKRIKSKVSVVTRTYSYGILKPVSGVIVHVNGKQIGKTNAKGAITFNYRGRIDKEAKLTLSAPGYIPAKWETSIAAKGKQRIHRMFYPEKPKPIKVGLYGYVNNSPEEDMSEVLNRIEEAISNNMFIYSSFSEVPKATLRDMMTRATLDMETVSTKGWQKTRLIRTVDMIISGSVTRDDSGTTIETTVNTADGSIILSQINKVRMKKNIKNTAKLIVKNIIDQFPFEGVIDAIEEDRYRLNLGKLDFKIRRGNEFSYMVATLNRSGKFTGFREAGALKVNETEDANSWVKIIAVNEGDQLQIGDRVVRRRYLEEEKAASKDSFTLLAKGGLEPGAPPLWGVNVYINNTWVGTTRSNGKVVVPVRLFEEHDILLSRHGYKPVKETFSVEKNKEVKEFALDVSNALFKVDSVPSGAVVFIDGVEIGTTPILDGTPVNFGFRKVKLSVGGEYRDWEKIMEFNKPEMDYLNDNKIVFLKDYMKIGKMAEQSGNIDAAILAYKNTERQSPDYSRAHCRLAQLYMDEKKDYDQSIREFENVLSLPENRQIIYKQFAVTYTNLGHAYYEKGNQLVQKDRRAAAGNFAKAIEKLRVAKQNIRFFPNLQFDEAVHDTYYYRAISFHKLYLITKKSSLLPKADRAWKEYFDFFPKNLEGKSAFMRIRSSAEKHRRQIKDLI
ncbi:MAG: PEGA domain-containing protein [Thermodesulfobacteriota bacterium]|nr:PEGA domain-containing protein [Thermodesulfobacteriota bacterium]